MNNNDKNNILRPLLSGALFAIGFIGTALLAVSVGTISTFSSGSAISSSAVNANFANLKTAIESVKEPPVGSIVAWHKSLSGTPSLPNGWVECSGQVLNDVNSAYNGMTMPNLNSAWSGSMKGRFLRGDTTSGNLENDDTAKKNLYISNGSVELSNATDSGGYGASYERVMISHPTGTPSTRPNVFNSLSISGGGTETRPANMSVVYIIRIK